MTLDDKELDDLLSQREIAPPSDFSQNLMRSVYSESESLSHSFTFRDIAQWIALGVGGILGMGQSLYFLLSAWVFTAAG